MQARRLLLPVLAVTLVCGLVAAPAGAAAGPKLEKKQNKALKVLNKRTKKAGKKINKVAADLGKVSADVGNIQAAVPTVISSLTQLADAAKQLKAGLEKAGAGLTLLKDNFTAYVSGAEYGVVQLYVGGQAAEGQLLVSSDIPDDGNQATVSGKLIAAIPDGVANAPLSIRAGVRSGEKDGTGAANPAAHAGLMSMAVTKVGGPDVTLGGGHPGTQQALPLLSAQPALDAPPVYPIAEKAPRSDASPNPFAFPLDKTIDLTDPATLLAVTGPPAKFTVSNADTGDPGTNTPVGAVIVDVTVRFNDLSASATDLNE